MVCIIVHNGWCRRCGGGLSLSLGKSTKFWLITKVRLDAFTRHIRLHNVVGSVLIY